MAPRTVAPRTVAPLEVVAALCGRQNAGKTSILMHVTGSLEKPVNFPGSSVERGEASTLVEGTTLRMVDLPGIVSLASVSPDESIALSWLGSGDADVLCAVVDASKLAVELTLVANLASLGRPVVVALTKTDVASRAGRPVDALTLAERLELEVVEFDGRRGEGAEELARVLCAVAGGEERSAWSAGEGLGEAELRALAEEVQGPEPEGHTTRTDRLDGVLLHPLLGLPLLAVLMLGIFQLIFVGADPFIAGIEWGQVTLEAWVEGLLEPGALRNLVIGGLINGVGSVVVFLPQIVMLMAIITLLESSGYMARAAFLLDRVLRRVGLSGRSFVPLMSSFACAVPGVLATRILDDERDRLATIVTAPLMSCSARLPVYVVLIGAFVPVAWAGTVLFAMYAVGIVAAALVAWSLRKTVLRGPVSALMMELPAYQWPSWRVVMGQVWVATREFLVLAGTVIFTAAVVVWALSYYPRPASLHDRFEAERVAATAAEPEGVEREAALALIDAREETAYLEQSYLAEIGHAAEPVFEPAGFDWRITVGILSAFPAREIIVPTLGILYSAGEVDPGDYELASLGRPDLADDGLRSRLQEARGPDGKPTFDLLVALSLMVFIALCSQCVSTLGAIRRETRSWRWPVFTFTYMTIFAWGAAVLVYQVGRALGYGGA